MDFKNGGGAQFNCTFNVCCYLGILVIKNIRILGILFYLKAAASRVGPNFNLVHQFVICLALIKYVPDKWTNNSIDNIMTTDLDDSF